MSDRKSGQSAPALTCVAYHHFESVCSEATSHLGISTPPEVFAAHLDHFQAHYDIIGLDELLTGPMPGRPLLITIDDAYRSVRDVAAPMLAARRIPAVLFANPVTISGPRVPLDNLMSLAACKLGMSELSRMVAGEPVPGATVGNLIASCIAPLSLRQREDLRHDLLGRLSVEERRLHRLLDLFLTPKQLVELQDFGIEIANHTATHVHCRALSADELATEITGGKAMLEQLTGRPVRAFSFPYGNEQDATPPVLELLRATGHHAQFLVHARSNALRPAPDVWYRTSLTDEAASFLPLKLGLLPRLRTLKTASKSLMSSLV
jgi:peptidoglycan/xylan/chitin deacetylase (PgdA/CDA1 family)